MPSGPPTYRSGHDTVSLLIPSLVRRSRYSLHCNCLIVPGMCGSLEVYRSVGLGRVRFFTADNDNLHCRTDPADVTLISGTARDSESRGSSRDFLNEDWRRRDETWTRCSSPLKVGQLNSTPSRRETNEASPAATYFTGPGQLGW